MRTALVAALALSLSFAAAVTAQETGAVSAATALSQLKTLEGRWDGHILTPDGPAGAVEYKVTAGGTVVMETLFAGEPHEMVTMYSVEGDDLIATHYCSGNNQPTMKLDRAASTADKLVFTFVSVKGANRKAWIDHGYINLLDDGKLEAGWGMNTEEGAPKKFYLAKAK